MTTIRTDLPGLDALSLQPHAIGAAAVGEAQAQPFADFSAFAGEGGQFGLGQGGAGDPAQVARQVLDLIAQG